MTTIAYQLYCSRNYPPITATLGMLADVGYRAVEGYGGLLGDPGALRDNLEMNGLAMPSCHVGLDMVAPDKAAATLATAKMLGVQKVIVPYVMPEDRPADTDGWKAFARKLNEAGKPFRDAGMVFGWHNHAFEFERTPTGDLPIDVIAGVSDDLSLELDLGWVRVAGHDPIAWINKFAGRLAAVHVKDIAPDGACLDEDGWADVGQGIMDWAAVHAALRDAGVDHYVVEHDNPNDDKRFASRSLAAIKSF